MSDLNFPKILAELEKLNTQLPDMRFGQVIQCAVDHHRHGNNINLNDRSSKDILTCLQEFTRHHTEKRAEFADRQQKIKTTGENNGK